MDQQPLDSSEGSVVRLDQIEGDGRFCLGKRDEPDHWGMIHGHVVRPKQRSGPVH